MYIVWRKRLIKTDRPAELFVSYFHHGGKRGRFSTCELPAWQRDPLFCRHTGPGRVTWTPLLMHAERDNAKPRQKLLRRFHSIRSCCIDDPFMRAAWWHSIEEWAETVHDMTGHAESLYFFRDRKAVLAKLREVVPPATKAGAALFTVYREEREAANRRAWQEHQDARRRQEEQEKQERQEQERRRQENFWRQTAAFMGQGPPWWDVLGVPPTAGLADVQSHYRELAKQHHPDRGGDANLFMRVQAAYDQARTIHQGR
jgi:hypothetical protein